MPTWKAARKSSIATLKLKLPSGAIRTAIYILDEAISAHHARISYHHLKWWLEDHSSTNGTFIGKSKLTVPTVLITSDQFKCGNTLFTVEMDALNEKLDL